jgi:predicted lipid-binding transport protein (Tim44 family)
VPLIVAIVVVLTVAIALAVAVRFVRGDQPEPPAAVVSPASTTTTRSIAPTPSYDAETVKACKAAGAAVATDTPDPEHAKASLAAAELSDVGTLRDLVEKYDYDRTLEPVQNTLRLQLGVIKIATWCARHDLDYRS